MTAILFRPHYVIVRMANIYGKFLVIIIGNNEPGDDIFFIDVWCLYPMTLSGIPIISTTAFP